MAVTPEEYKQHLRNNIITMEMLEECLYSCNKRAKNCRDKARAYRRNTKYDYSGKYTDMKEEHYKRKEILLSLLEPICIHKVVKRFIHRVRVYEGDPEYEMLKHEDVIYYGEEWESDGEDYEKEGKTIQFKVTRKNGETVLYFLYYETLDGSFHSPILQEEISEKYGNLEVIEIENFETYGEDIEDLLSVQFCDKVINLIQTKNFTLVEDREAS